MAFIPCGMCNQAPCQCGTFVWPSTGTATSTLTWPPTHPRISDEDIDRIAKRVVELLRQPAPAPHCNQPRQCDLDDPALDPLGVLKVPQ